MAELSANLSASVNEVLVGRQRVQTHGAACVQLLGGDTDLSAKAKLTAVGEAGGGVHVDGRGINAVTESVGGRDALGDNGLAVTRGVKILLKRANSSMDFFRAVDLIIKSSRICEPHPKPSPQKRKF